MKKENTALPAPIEITSVPLQKNDNDFLEVRSTSDKTEYILIYCKKCGIVSYDQRYKSRSYESRYVPSKCL